MNEYFARDIMKDKVFTINSSFTAADAAEIMSEQGIGCLIVVEKGLPVGIITERDFITKIIVNGKPMSTPLSEVMSYPLISVGPDATIWELAEQMKLSKVHKVPIIHEKKLLGIVTTSDITRLCSIGSDSEMRMVCQQILRRLNQD